MAMTKPEGEQAGGEEAKTVEEIIATILRYRPHVTVRGSTIQQLSNATSVPRSTVAWHLNRLKGAGAVESQTVGRAEVYFLASNTTGGDGIYGSYSSEGRTEKRVRTSRKRK